MKSTFNHVKNTLKNKVVQVGYSTSKVTIMLISETNYCVIQWHSRIQPDRIGSESDQ